MYFHFQTDSASPPTPQTKKDNKKEEGLFVDLHAWVPCEQL